MDRIEKSLNKPRKTGVAYTIVKWNVDSKMKWSKTEQSLAEQSRIEKSREVYSRTNSIRQVDNSVDGPGRKKPKGKEGQEH